MGVYDFLKGPCPKCGKEIGADSGDIQIKWFSAPVEGECFRTFKPGDVLPAHIDNGLHAVGTYSYCCGTEKILYAKVENNHFMGFVHGDTPEEYEQKIKEELGLPSDVEVVTPFSRR